MCLNSKILTRTTHMLLIKTCVCVFCKNIYNKKDGRKRHCAHHDKIIKRQKKHLRRGRDIFPTFQLSPLPYHLP